MYLSVRQICQAGVDTISSEQLLLYDFTKATKGSLYFVNKRDNGWGISMSGKYIAFQLVIS